MDKTSYKQRLNMIKNIFLTLLIGAMVLPSATMTSETKSEKVYRWCKNTIKSVIVVAGFPFSVASGVVGIIGLITTGFAIKNPDVLWDCVTDNLLEKNNIKLGIKTYGLDFVNTMSTPEQLVYFIIKYKPVCLTLSVLLAGASLLTGVATLKAYKNIESKQKNNEKV
jgi:hypothetical protein